MLHEYQHKDKKLWNFPEQKPTHNECHQLGEKEIVCTREQHWRICVSDEMLPQLIKWYHAAMTHVEGMSRLEDTLNTHFFHPRLQA